MWELKQPPSWTLFLIRLYCFLLIWRQIIKALSPDIAPSFEAADVACIYVLSVSGFVTRFFEILDISVLSSNHSSIEFIFRQESLMVSELKLA